jgi:hypothetical protein
MEGCDTFGESRFMLLLSASGLARPLPEAHLNLV